MSTDNNRHGAGNSEILENIIRNLSLFLFLLDKNKCFVNTYNTPKTVKGTYTQDDIIGKPLSTFMADPKNPFYQACFQINKVFDQVLESGIPATIQYTVFDRTLEAIVSRMPNEIILGQVRDITDIIQSQQAKEAKRQNELSMALTAGGIASWCYETSTDLITSSHQNDIIGASISRSELLKLVIPEHRILLLSMYDRLLNKGSIREKVTLQALNQQGDTRWYTLHAIPDSYTPDGKVSTIIGSQKDVTNEQNRQEILKRTQKEALAANKLLLALIDFIPCPLFIKDADSDHRYIVSNQLFCQENGFTEHDVIGKTDFEIYPKEKAQIFYQQDQEVLNNEGPCRFEKHTRANGIEKIWQTTKTKVTFQDHKKLLIGVMLDITDKTQAMERLHEAKRMAERSDKLKSAFLANMSHEIRTPLNAIVGFSQLLSSSEEIEDRNTYINIINTNSEHLLTLINDILDLSKIESGYIDCKNDRFNLHQLLLNLEMTFIPKIPDSVKFICQLPETPCQVNLDKLRVSQIITNLLTNAIKFTSTGSIVFGYETHKKGIKLFVKDTGSGIAKENLPKVFDRFEKFDPFKQGTGLGTSICKAITDAYQGEIGVTSTVNEGSYFWAYLPTEIHPL